MPRDLTLDPVVIPLCVLTLEPVVTALCIDTRGHSARPGIDIRLNVAWSIGGRTVAAFNGNPLLFHKVARCISGGTGASLYATLLRASSVPAP